MAIFPDTNVTGLADFFLYTSSGVNTFIPDAMGIGISLTLFFMMFLMFKTFSFRKAFAVSGYIIVLLGLFLMKIGLLRPTTWWIEIIIFIIAYYLLEDEHSRNEP